MKNDASGYFAYVDAVRSEWTHLIEALRAAGAEGADLEQTGGMVMAIQWPLPQLGPEATAGLATSYGGLDHERTACEAPGWGCIVYRDAEDSGEGTFFELPGRPGDPAEDEAAAAAILARFKTLVDEISTGAERTRA